MGSLVVRSLAIAAWMAAAGMAGQSLALASEPTEPKALALHHDAGLKPLALGIGKSAIIDLPRDAKDVLVANPGIANAIMRTSRRVYLIGLAVGQTNIFFFDEHGRQIAGLDIAVTRNLNGIRAALQRALPDANIKVEGIGEEGVILTGSVANQVESQLAQDIAQSLLLSRPTSVSTGVYSGGAAGGTSNSTTTSSGEGKGSVVNALTVRGKDQVMLKVTVSEVQRDIIKQLGVELNAQLGTGNAVVNFATKNPFSISNQAPPNSLGATWRSGVSSVGATVRALERAGVMRTLAEPNLTAISGESASFLAGGEFPVPAGITCDVTTGCQTRVEFKKFGVGLNFTPVVLSEGRISLRVATEVSELSGEGALPLVAGTGAASATLTIPALRVRRADTTVEIPSGGTLAMAGMIQEQTKQAINGLPGLMQVPILGTLFKSRDFANRQTELVVFVTPYVVKPVAQKNLSRPDDGFSDASDPETILLGKFNKVYGMPGRADPDRRYYGKPGFILD